MTPPAAQIMSPGAWQTYLAGKLDAQNQAIQQSEDYYNGNHRLAWATAKFREAFARFYPPMAHNWMKLVVDTPVSRLEVQGFRFDPDPSSLSWELAADTDAWTMWQASNMDSGSDIAHTDAIKHGVSYVLIVPPARPGQRGPDGNPLWPRIIPQQAFSCYVEKDAEDPSNRLAGIKRWTNPLDGYAYCNVYLPDTVYKWRTVEKPGQRPLSDAQWTSIGSTDVSDVGRVLLCPIENKPDLTYDGRSDLEEAIPIQDAINKYALDMLVASEFHAFPQRYVTGWERPVDSSGRALSDREVELHAGLTRLITLSKEGANIGQLDPGDVQNYIQPIETHVDHLAATTMTPAYYLKGSMANLSADALHAADSGLVDRCNRKIRNSLSDNWEEVMRTAFLANGDAKRGNALTAEVIWKNPERQSLAQLMDAAIKGRDSLSMPIEMCWQMLGWSPEQIRQARDLMGLPPGGPQQAGVPVVLPASDPGALLYGPDGLPIGKYAEPKTVTNPVTGTASAPVAPASGAPATTPASTGAPARPPR